MLLEHKSLFSDNNINISEFTLDDMRTISFHIENDSDIGLYNFLISKIDNSCNCIDKFAILLQARSKFINDIITFNNGESNISINIKLLYNNLIKNIVNIRNTINIDEFYITLDYPDELFYKNEEFLEADCIKSIIYKGREVNTQNLKIEEKFELYERLPIKIIQDVKKFVDNNKTEVILMEAKLGLPQISINPFNNDAFSITKTLYNYYEYENIIDILFTLSKRIPDVQYLNTRNPRDLENIIRLYQDEVANSSSPVKFTL